MQITAKPPTIINGDHQSLQKLIKNSQFLKRINNIDTQYYIVIEKYNSNEIEIEYVETP